MATVYLEVAASMVDEINVPASYLEFGKVDDTTTISQLVTALQTYLGHLHDVSGAKIESAHCRLILDVSTHQADSPTAGSRVEQTGLFNFEQDGSPYKFGLDLPAIDDALLVGGRIDLTNTVVSDWIDMHTTGISPLFFTSKYRLDLAGLADAILTFRKHRRALDKVSFEGPA